MRNTILYFPFVFATALCHGLKGAPYARYGSEIINLYSCNLQMMHTVSFCSDPLDAGFACSCKNSNALATLAGCFNNGKKPVISEATLALCEKNYLSPVSVEQFQEAYINFTLRAKTIDEIPGFNLSIPVDVPIRLDPEIVSLYKRAYRQFLGNYDNSLYYGSGMLGFWLLVFLVVAVSHWSKLLFPGVVKYFTGPTSNILRKYITLPATGRRRRTNEKPLWKVFDFLVPSRKETIIIFLFTCLTIFCNSHNIVYIKNDPIFTKKSDVLLRYTADRTGITASIIMPLLVLFAGRNNFLQWLTGWNFAVYISFHRWIARIVFALVFVHAVTFSFALGTKYYAEDMKETYLVWGTLATVAGGIIMVQGLMALRRRWYEIFLIIHIIMAALFIGGSWIHVDELGYVWFYYAATAVWAFDRLVRILRLVTFGCPESEVSFLSDETLKVVVPKAKYWRAIPGGHAFVHFLRPSCFWQSHPFTFTTSTSQETENSIVLYCKVKGGVTHGLYQYLATHPGKRTTIRVSLEGPYGESTPAKRYDSAVFVAGGNGIPGIYSEIYDLALKQQENSDKILKLFWVVREYKSLYWFYEELLALKSTKIECTVFVTQPDSESCINEFASRMVQKFSDTESEDKSDSYKEKITEEGSVDIRRIVHQIHNELNHINFVEGRPCMDSVVKQEIEDSPGSVAFIVCGHPLMVDDLRYSVAHSLDYAKGKRVDFFEQLQVWA